MIAPNKLRHQREYWSEEMNATPRDSTNYEVYVDVLAKAGIPFLDYNALFEAWIPDQEYPMLLRYGTHWSMYGGALAADTMLSRMGDLLGKPVRKFSIDSVEETDEARLTDADLRSLLNTTYPIGKETVGFPHLSFDDTTGFRPRVLSISDSYYWSFYHLGIVRNCLHPDARFWFYHKTAFDNNMTKLGTAYTTDLEEELEHIDLLLLMATDANLENLGTGSIERLYAHFTGGEWTPIGPTKQTRKHRISRYGL